VPYISTLPLTPHRDLSQLEQASEDETSMRSSETPPPAFLATFSRQRQQLLTRVSESLFPDQAVAPDAARAEALGQCLLTSLEELKVAEEEMLNQQLELLSMKAESDRAITYWRTMFDLAPVALMLTTSDAVIRATNQSAAEMLTRDVYHLEGKPFSAIVNQAMRAEFRAQLKHVVAAGGVEAWSMVLDRKTREPIRVEAKVQLIPSALTGTPAMYWAFRPTPEPAAADRG
jgi:PAS domain-containing protein